MDTAPGLTKRSAILNGIVLCALITVFFTVLSLVLHTYLLNHVSISVSFIITRIIFWGYFMAMWWHAAIAEKLPVVIWKDQKYGFGFYVGSVVLILISITVTGACIALIMKAAGQSLTNSSKVVALLKSLSIPVKLFGVITAAIAEELIFRGYLMPRLQLYFKQTWQPIVISSLIFGFGHIGYGTVINVVMPVVIGLIFAWYYQKYRNIKVLMICHFLIDFNALIIPHHR